MTNFFKSDLTYSIAAGFLIGALALFFSQPVAEQQQLTQNISSLVSSTQVLFK